MSCNAVTDASNKEFLDKTAPLASHDDQMDVVLANVMVDLDKRRAVQNLNFNNGVGLFPQGAFHLLETATVDFVERLQSMPKMWFDAALVLNVQQGYSTRSIRSYFLDKGERMIRNFREIRDEQNVLREGTPGNRLTNIFFPFLAFDRYQKHRPSHAVYYSAGNPAQ